MNSPVWTMPPERNQFLVTPFYHKAYSNHGHESTHVLGTNYEACVYLNTSILCKISSEVTDVRNVKSLQLNALTFNNWQFPSIRAVLLFPTRQKILYEMFISPIIVISVPNFKIFPTVVIQTLPRNGKYRHN